MSSPREGFYETSLGKQLEEAEYFFTTIFALEMVLKIVAMGFIVGKGTYLRDGKAFTAGAGVVFSWILLFC